ncbi:hypothetical protein EV126DRAFT_419598, partial [Verticillium dahliae]
MRLSCFFFFFRLDFWVCGLIRAAGSAATYVCLCVHDDSIKTKGGHSVEGGPGSGRRGVADSQTHTHVSGKVGTWPFAHHSMPNCLEALAAPVRLIRHSKKKI